MSINETEVTLKDIKPDIEPTVQVSINTEAIAQAESTGVRTVSIADIRKDIPEDPNKEVGYVDGVDEILSTMGMNALEEAKKKAIESIIENPELFKEILEDDEADTLEVQNDSTEIESDVEVDDSDDYNKVDLEEKETEVDDREAQYNKLKEVLKERIKPVADKIDLSTFTISSKPIKLHKAMSENFKEPMRVADWALPATGTPISMREFSALEIQSLNTENSTRNEFNTQKDLFKVFYDHLVGSNLPKFEEFLQIVKYEDIDHLYYAAYKSSFDKENLIPYVCPSEKCKHLFVKDVAIADMVKFKDEDAEKAFKVIMEDVGGFTKSEKDSELVQINSAFVVALRVPSVYDVILEPRMLSQAYREKHSTMISTLSYIDNIYTIDRATNQLEPLDYGFDANDLQKSYKKKIDVYGEILQTLDSKQHFALMRMIDNIPTTNDNVSYIVPSCTCEKCNTVISEDNSQSAQSLLFTQHQLAAIANS